MTGRLQPIWIELMNGEEGERLKKLIVNIDGKTMRGGKTSKRKALHIVSAFSVEHGVSFGQVKTEEKSNEITAIPELLKDICIERNIVTIDAMGTQKAIAEQIIVKNKADYVLAVREYFLWTNIHEKLVCHPEATA